MSSNVNRQTVTPELISSLKHLSGFSPNFFYDHKNEYMNILSTDNLYVYMKNPQKLQNSFGIYELSRFVSCLSLYNNPEIQICDDEIKIFGGSNVISYKTSQKNILKVPNEKAAIPPKVTPVISVVLRNDILNKFIKFYSIVGGNDAPHFIVSNEGSKTSIKIGSAEHVKGSLESIVDGFVDDDSNSVSAVIDFKALVKIDSTRDYRVNINAKGNVQIIALSLHKTDSGDESFIENPDYIVYRGVNKKFSKGLSI